MRDLWEDLEGGKDREKCCNDIIISKIKKLKIPECNWSRNIEFYFISNPSWFAAHLVI